jgi:hypothetical protein
MKTFGLFQAIALASMSALNGQALRDSVLPNPVRISARLQLIATLERANVKLGEPMIVHAHYKNVSSNGLDLSPIARNSMISYALTVTDAAGAELQRTAAGESWLRGQRVENTSAVLAPVHLDPGAEGREFVVDAAQYYNLTKPGTYFVRLMFRSPGPDPNEPRPTTSDPEKIPVERAVSDLISFTIAP